MQEPHKKGLANHLDPESCAGGREAAGEALTGAHAGQPLSSEITSFGLPTLYGDGEGNMDRKTMHRKCGRFRLIAGLLPIFGPPEMGVPSVSVDM